MGNRITETTIAGTTVYAYDDANRMTSVGGMSYTWSANGNLLSDGTYTYAYDHASRLTSASWGTLAYGFTYNGQGDRLRQTVGGTPTNYSLDPIGGLTQVLSDGTNAYLYGVNRIGEEQTGGWEYHLGDALGSVRQLADAAVNISLTRSYEPFGDGLSTARVWNRMSAGAHVALSQRGARTNEPKDFGGELWSISSSTYSRVLPSPFRLSWESSSSLPVSWASTRTSLFSVNVRGQRL